MTSSNTHSHSSFSPESIVSGSGVWAPGSTVREIEGHFHPDNEPKNAVPISGTGGVPQVDFDPRHHGHSSSGSGLTGSHTGTGSGLTGSHTGSGLTGSHTGSGLTGSHTGSGLTGDHTAHSSTTGTGSGLTGSHRDNTTNNNGKTGIVEKVKEAVSGNKTGSDYDSNRDQYSTNASGLTGQTGRTGHSDYTGTTGAGVGTTGSSSTATTGATHGISDSAERNLQGTSGLTQTHGGHTSGVSHGTTGATGAGLTGAGLTGVAAGAPGTAARTNESGGSGIATHLRNEAETRTHGHTGDVTTGRTGDITTGRTGDVGTHTGTVPATGATGAHSTTGHHASSAHNHNNTTGTDSPKKEGLLAKLKHII